MAETKKQQIYNEIKRRIVEGEYPPKDMLTERSLAAEFNVSKTPVRECLSNLCQEGYLERFPNCGYMITELSFAETLALAEMRIIVETAAARLVIKYATDEEIQGLYQYLDSDEDSSSIGLGSNTSFHCAIAHLTHNPFIEDTIRSLVMHATKSSQAIIQNNDTAFTHAAILKALSERNVEDAEKYLKQDIAVKEQREL